MQYIDVKIKKFKYFQVTRAENKKQGGTILIQGIWFFHKELFRMCVNKQS